ncbi:MAG: tetratricopeptide repeat protein, partial [Planctomycetes bacterium]|nr:tetratricopeptide repeat protein [Planctomycetota bacterium]
MRHAIIAVGVVGAFTVAQLPAQQPPAEQPAPAEQAVDPVSRQATEMEGQLGKYADSAPEAAEIMVKLAELYHQHGRVFGLVRAAQRFVAAHPTDPRHKDMMLRLIDGLEAASRNKDLAVACRQFLARYPQAGECAAVEVRLAATEDQLEDPIRAAEAYRLVWQRQPNANGRVAGVNAAAKFATSGNHEIIAKGAALSEEMLDKLPNGSFAEECGWRAFWEWRRIARWAESNAVGLKLLGRGLPADRERQWSIHRYMAENYWNQSQHANAADSLAKARAIRDDQYAHYQQIQQAYSAGVKGPQLEPLVNEYVQKYPQRPDRFERQALLGHAFLRDGDKPRALQIFASLLPHEAVGHSLASVYVQNNGNEPPQVAQSEQALVAAIAQNPKQAYYLRHVLAFEIYRDRVKDNAKAKQVLREMLSSSPSDDGHSWNAISWLLSVDEDENEFRQDVARIIAARRQHLHWTNFRSYLANWQQQAKRNKDLQARAEFVAQELAKADADPVTAAFLQVTHPYQKESVDAREKLLEPALFAQLNDELARHVLYGQAYYYRHYSPGEQRVKSAELFGQLAKKFPQEYDAAVWYLQSATDYSPPEVQKEAAANMLRFEPQSQDSDLWRRLMLAADRNADAALAQQSLAWILKCQQQHGRHPNYASYIGDVLVKLKLENEAVQYWTTYVAHDRNSHESRECASRLIARIPPEQEAQSLAYAQELFQHDTDFHGRYAQWIAAIHLKNNRLDQFEQVLRESKRRQNERPFRGWDIDPWTAQAWVDTARANQEQPVADKQRIYTAVRDLDIGFPSGAAALALLELEPPEAKKPIERLLAYQHATRIVGNTTTEWDRLMPYAQALVGNKNFAAAATLLTGMLSNIPQIDDGRRKTGRDMVAQAYGRMGSVGLTIDDNSPIAPLLQAVLYLRLGDESLALETYQANKELFAEHKTEVPLDLLLFVCNSQLAGGTEAGFEFVEDVLRSWLVKHSESQQVDPADKARVQLLLAKSFFTAQRYDIARIEYTTVINRYPDTAEALEAEFGIGETFMAQKVYDQAEQVFEKLAGSRNPDVIVRAEFLKGVLTYRRGDRDEARDIFRGVLEKVPSVELANQALFNLAEVYGDEERYIDQLNLLRTVGRLGRASKRWHRPGTALSIVVQDSDLGISRGHQRIPVKVRTEPGGDEETIYLVSGGAGKGLFRGDLETRLGEVSKNNNALELTGRDVVRCDYPQEFKAEFKHVPLSDVEIRIAADAKFEVSSSRIIDEEEESFSDRLEREAREAENADQRVSQGRPANQVKPGNLIYVRVQDPDRDLSEQPDKTVAKLTADSGDEVQIELTETGPHTGVFEATAKTGELPAGAQASDTAIEHNPLMAIDRDAKTFWLSEPDGQAPKTLTVDMKDLETVSRVRISTPELERNAPVRGTLLGSDDGQFWFHLAGNPAREAAEPVAEDYGRMKQRIFDGRHTNFSTWQQVVNLSKNSQPLEDKVVDELTYSVPADAEDAKRPRTAIWHGKLVQERAGAARIAVRGALTAVALDGNLELPLGPGNRHVDVWLERGTHDLTIFSAVNNASDGVEATWMRADHSITGVVLRPFRKSDFDLDQPAAKLQPEPNVAAAAAREIPLSLDTVKVEKTTEQFGVVDQNGTKTVGAWQNANDWVHWEFDVPAAGAYDVLLDYAHAGGGSKYSLEFGLALGQPVLTGTLANTGGWGNFRNDRIGTILVAASGRYKLAIRPVELVNGHLMVLKGVTLKAADGPRVI